MQFVDDKESLDKITEDEILKILNKQLYEDGVITNEVYNKTKEKLGGEF